MGKNTIREWIGLHTYDSRSKVLKSLNFLSLLFSSIAILSTVYYYGVSVSPDAKEWLFDFILFTFGFYVLRYFVRLFYSFNIKEYLKESWFEGLFISILLIDGLSYLFLGEVMIIRILHRLGFENIGAISNLFLQIYLFFIVLMEITAESDFLPKIRVNPSYIFIATFLVIISVGTILLLLPNMSTSEGGISFLDALFTATSASCVTGLIVVDTATAFTFKGQMVILILMKLGGLNIISYGAFAAMFSKMGVGAKQHSVVEDFIFHDAAFSSKSYLSKIIIGTVVFEIIGALVISFLMQDKFPDMSSNKIAFFSVFHAVSAFNNAGFSTISDGFLNAEFNHFFLLHFVISALIFFGAMGFVNFFDLFGRKKLRERLMFSWKKPALGPRIEIWASVILVITGTVAFMLFEHRETFEGYNFIESSITGLFQSITLRTAGFSTIDFGAIGMPTMIIALIWMFIGGSSSSTAGGIKTSTISVLWLSAKATITGKKHVEVFNRTISPDLLNRAYSIFLFSISSIMVGVFLLSITEGDILQAKGHNVIDLIFEEVSAFSTVGLSTGITSMMSSYGKIILIVSMFVGRVGTLTIGFALNRSPKSTNYKYPEGKMLIG